MTRFKVGKVDLEESVIERGWDNNMGHADYYAELASAISDIKNADAKAEKAKKKQKKYKKKSKRKIKEAEKNCGKVLVALKAAEKARADLEVMLKEEQLHHEYDCKVLGQQLNYERLLAKHMIRAASREMNLIAAMQHPEISKKLVDQYVAVAGKTITDNCVIEGDANEI